MFLFLIKHYQLNLIMNYNKEILSMKDILTNMIITYKKLSQQENNENKDIKEQFNNDYNMILNLRNCSLMIFDKCNKIIVNN